MERRLAAVLACDVAGYSRAMCSDETGTLAQLKTCRHELIDPRRDLCPTRQDRRREGACGRASDSA